MEDYIKNISAKYNGKIHSEPVKKTHTYHGEFVNGKYQATVLIENLKVVFAIDYSDLATPFTSGILIPGIYPKKCNFIPKRRLFAFLFTEAKSLRKVYRINVDNELLHKIKSNTLLTELLIKNKTHIVIRKKANHRLLVIHPYFSILNAEDFSKFEQITEEIISCLIAPKLV